MMQALTRHISPGWLLVAPFFLVVVAFYLGPLANILWLSVTDPEPGLGNYEKLVENDALARILWTTFRTCAITTVFSVGIGYCLAYAMVHAHRKNQNIMLTLLLISFWISVLVRTFAWLMLLGHNGLVNNGMEAIGLIDRPVRFMRNELGVLIGMVHYMVPYAVLPLMANMQTLDPRVMAASRNLGASGAQTFRRIYLPLTIPGLVASSLLVFILSLGFYVTPADPWRGQGADGGRIYQRAASGDAPMGHRRDAGHADADRGAGASMDHVAVHAALGRLRRGGDAMRPGLFAKLNVVGAWLALLFLVLPALIAIPVSLTPKRFLSMPKGEYSLRHFENLFTSPEWLSSFAQSGIIAASTALLATTLGTLCAIGLWRVTSRYTEVVRAFLLLPLIIPQIISAMVFYRLLVPMGLIDSYPGLILAHTVLATPLVLITVSASLANFDPQARTGQPQPRGAVVGDDAACDPAVDQARRGGRGAFRLHPELGRDRRHALHLEIHRLHPAPADVERHPREHRPDRGGGRRRADRRHASGLRHLRPAGAPSRADGCCRGITHELPREP